MVVGSAVVGSVANAVTGVGIGSVGCEAAGGVAVSVVGTIACVVGATFAEISEQGAALKDVRRTWCTYFL